MSDFSDERDESGAEDEENEYLEFSDPQQRLKAAQRWIKSAVGRQERTPAEVGTRKIKLTEHDVHDFFHIFPDLTGNENDDTRTVLSAAVDMVVTLN
jgi:hypothetical protein